jgi:hypothetical protein
VNIDTIIVSALTSVVIAWLTMRLALHRFYREKWWDKRATAYLELIDVLYYFKKDYEVVYNSAFAERFLDQDDSLQFDILSDEKEKEYWARIGETHEKLSKIMELGPLIFTEAALEKLAVFDERGDEVARAVNDDEFDKYEAYQEISGSADNLYEDFKSIALVELKLKPRYEIILKKIWSWMYIQYARAKDDYNANFK